VKSLVVVRKLDGVGRITLPKKILRSWGIEHNDGLEIAVDGNYIILSKYRPVCIFCGSADGITEIKNKYICEDCISSISGKHDE